ncbi:MAG: Maf family protein [Actinomycetota bacterium]|jgi:septum formation protein|nr:Maf family protein [Actinomycetota bacterium]
MFLEGNNKIKIILASKSPRRADILNKLNINFEVITPTLKDEKLFDAPDETVIYNSLDKAKNIASYVKIKKSDFFGERDFKDIVIAGFDTVVFLDGKFFLKPKDKEEAREFLKIFSGRTHKVYSGISLISISGKSILSDYDVTDVTFNRLSDKDIDDYLNKENVLDKAGAYNLDGYGCILIKKIEGCFYNVAGLPVYKFLAMIKNLGYSLKDFQE